MSKTLELKEQRSKLALEARGIVELSEKEQRNMTGEEREKFDKMMVDVDALRETIATEERKAVMTDLTTELNTSTRAPERRIETRASYSVTGQTNPSDGLRGWLSYGAHDRMPGNWLAAAEDAGMNLRSPRITLQFRTQQQMNETRAMGEGSTAAGDALVPVEFQKELEWAMKYYGAMMRTSRVLPTADSRDLRWPLINDTQNKATIQQPVVPTNAVPTPPMATDLAFAERLCKMYPYSTGTVLVPITLMADSAIPIDGIVARALGERFGRGFNSDLTIGTGQNMPYGILNQVHVGLEASGLTFSAIQDLITSLDVAYWPDAQFQMHQKLLGVVRKIVDDNHRPIFLPGFDGLGKAAPDTLMGYKVDLNSDYPQSDEAGLGPIVTFGQHDKMLVRLHNYIELVRLNEVYIAFGFVGFVGWRSMGGVLLDAGTHPVQAYQHSSGSEA